MDKYKYPYTIEDKLADLFKAYTDAVYGPGQYDTFIEVQKREVKRAFYAGFADALFFMSFAGQKLPESVAAGKMRSMLNEAMNPFKEPTEETTKTSVNKKDDLQGPFFVLPNNGEIN